MSADPLSLDSLTLEEEREYMNQLVGLESRPTEKGEFVPNDFLPEDPLLHQTKPKIWQQGTTHFLFIGGSAALVVLLLALVYNAFVGNHNLAQIPEKSKSADDFFKSPNDSEIGVWKTEAALSQQRGQLQSLNAPPPVKSSPSPTTQPSAINPPTETQVAPKSIQQANEPVRVNRRQERQANYVAPPRTFQYPTPSSIPIRVTQPLSSPPLVRSPISLPAPLIEPRHIPTAEGNPLAMLEAASKVGVYTSSNSQPVSSAYTSPYSRTLPVDSRSALSSSTTVPVTTRVRAKVVTGIIWSGKTEQKFKVQLTEPMLTQNGTTVLGKGTFLIAQVDQANTVNLIAASVDGQDIPLPPDTLLVQHPSGEPFQASMKKSPSGLGKTFGLAILSGVSSAAKTLNTPTIVSSGGSTTVSNQNPDIGAAALEGVTGQLVKTGTSEFEQNLKGQNSPQIYSEIKPGTKLQIFVNQPFSL